MRCGRFTGEVIHSNHARQQLHIDLSPCQHWVRLMEVWYHRSQTSHGVDCDYDEVTIVFMPDLWQGSPKISTLMEVVTDPPKVKEEVKEEKKEEKKEEVVEEKEEEMEEEEEEESGLTLETLNILRVTDLRALLQQRGMPTTVSACVLCEG